MNRQPISTLSQLQNALQNDPELEKEFQQDPLRTLRQIQQSPLATDKWIYRIIVAALGLTILAIVIGVMLLMATGKITDDQQVPTILTAIGSAAIGALAGLLAPSPKNG